MLILSIQQQFKSVTNCSVIEFEGILLKMIYR